MIQSFFKKTIDALTKDKKMLSNFYIQGLGQFLGRFLFFVFLMVSARVLGAHEFGVFSFSLSICYLFHTVMNFGLDHLAIKWVARQEFEIFSTIALTNLGTILFGFFLIFIVSFFFDRHIFLILNILGIGFCFFSVNTIVFSYFRGLEKMKLEPFILVGQRLILLLTSFVFLSINKSATAISISFSLSLFLAFLCIGVILYIKKINLIQNSEFAFMRQKIVSVLKEAFPLALVTGLGIIYYRIDSVMIAGYRQISDVGIYTGAYMVIEGVMLLVRVIMIASFSRLSQYGNMVDIKFYVLYKKLLILLIILSLILCSIMYGAGEFIFDLFLGKEYQSSVGVFYILLLSVIALYPGTLATHALIAIDKQKVYMYIALTCTITNILLNFIFIPRFGIQGAAWATVITDIILTVSCMAYLSLFFKKKVTPRCA
ncbi:flippase [Desulfobacula sp.]|uniref:flippase n=1 Tax=Desulfobacula sp. TaxID=2593537 RepID=UPI0026321E0B|nr:flippase [Desulfobacula sp.]